MKPLHPLKSRLVGLAGLASLASLAFAGPARAQSYVNAPGQIPQGSPFNNSFTENIDFADVDLDGDQDAVNADGGDCCNDQNRLWINKGFAQGGTIGFFQDETSTRFPAVQADGRDMDFVDFDADGDEDLYNSNTSANINQSNRFWVNMGGLQGGSAGFFQDQTSTRWVNIAVNNGTTTFSSIAPGTALGSGGFIDWSCDCVFGDLDNDGDMDLVHSTYGGAFGGNVPSRLFLNNGQGFFEEHNPSHFQLSGSQIANGNPALWCQGTHQHQTTNSTGAQADIADSPLGVEIGDLDGDLDIDILQGSRNNPPPRVYRNLFTDTGTLVWRDVTYAVMAQHASGSDNYEQELGDMNNDGDLDIYGLNWPGLNDSVQHNDGAGNFGSMTTLSGSGSDDNEGDWLDYNNDGNLDIFVINFSGQDRLYQGNGTGAFTHVTSSQLPSEGQTGLGGDSCDVDLDGDYDVLVGNDGGQANWLYKNVNQVFDNRAATIPLFEQAPDRTASPTPTRVRAEVYDNASWDVLRHDQVTLEYSVNGGAFTGAAMRHAGGQMFVGEIPGTLVGSITYRIKVRDEHSNTATSSSKSYNATGGGCTGNVTVYCTPKTSSNLCVPSISGAGTPSLSAPASFVIGSVSLEDGKNGLTFFSTTGANGAPFQGGFLCAKSPLYRLGVKNTGGAGICQGSLSYTLSDMLAHPSGGPLLVATQQVNSQTWFRDPGSPSTTGLSDGLQFVICP